MKPNDDRIGDVLGLEVAVLVVHRGDVVVAGVDEFAAARLGALEDRVAQEHVSGGGVHDGRAPVLLEGHVVDVVDPPLRKSAPPWPIGVPAELPKKVEFVIVDCAAPSAKSDRPAASKNAAVGALAELHAKRLRLITSSAPEALLIAPP